MTEAATGSRVTQENGTRRSNGSRGGVADSADGAPRYSEADLEPIRARLAAFAASCSSRPYGTLVVGTTAPGAGQGDLLDSGFLLELEDDSFRVSDLETLLQFRNGD